MKRIMKTLSFFLIITSISALCGCTTLRKKFIRKKIKPKDTPVYVDFKEYPTKPSRKAYINYYLFVRGWLDDLIITLERGISNKRRKRAIKEAVMNLEQIMGAYNKQGKDKIYPLYEDFTKIREEIDRNPNMSQIKRNTIVRKVKKVKRTFEKDFNYTDAKKWMN